MKKGAMFGLDARIALAIFGALSVITGAALFRAIQDTKMTAMYENLVEIEKAFEAYYLDTGVKGKHDTSIYKIGVLQKNLTVPVVGWKGPYLSSGDGALWESYLRHPNFSKIQAIGMKASYLDNTLACGFGSASANMDTYIMVDNVPDNTDCNGDLAFLKKVHDKYDSDGDYKKGKLRVLEHSTKEGQGSIFYKIDLLELRS